MRRFNIHRRETDNTINLKYPLHYPVVLSEGDPIRVVVLVAGVVRAGINKMLKDQIIAVASRDGEDEVGLRHGNLLSFKNRARKLTRFFLAHQQPNAET